jgi:hypothetical protein
VTSGPDVIDLLIYDHSALPALSTGRGIWHHNDSAAHLALGDRLLRHEIAEELVVYPVLLSCSGGTAVVDSSLQDQANIEHRLVQLERQEPGTMELERVSDCLRLELMAHLEKEESQVLPILASRLSRPRRIELAHRFRKVTQVVPIRRIPKGVRVATGRTVVDRTTALSVWMRDVVTASGLVGWGGRRSMGETARPD